MVLAGRPVRCPMWRRSGGQEQSTVIQMGYLLEQIEPRAPKTDGADMRLQQYFEIKHLIKNPPRSIETLYGGL